MFTLNEAALSRPQRLMMHRSFSKSIYRSIYTVSGKEYEGARRALKEVALLLGGLSRRQSKDKDGKMKQLLYSLKVRASLRVSGRDTKPVSAIIS